ncbi:MAG TPA: SIS domain-containing protein [Usitatibacter sp.]|nr:SIS domain-containing protein [Usitatibacter sp.]
MFREAAQAPGIVRAQISRNQNTMPALGAWLRGIAPRVVVTAARGSSDHAATFAKYVLETRMGLLTSSAAPSVSSIYGSRQDLRDCLFLAISQSGRSPDLLSAAEAAGAAGAAVIAVVNDDTSPLAALADHVVRLCAGAEESVAATKSYLASLAALLHLCAEWSADAKLLAALRTAPQRMEDAWLQDWTEAVALLQPATHLYVIARGVGLAVAQEAALKCKETCGLHAEAFSAAEVKHGPQALLGERFPALVLVQDDESRAGTEELALELVARGVPVMIAGAAVPGAVVLPTVEADAAIAPLLLAQSFYRMANALAIARGFDPDNPPHLRKVTETR